MKKKVIPLFIIPLLTIAAWYKILFQTFTGEGYIYLFRGVMKDPLTGIDNNFFRFNIGAALLFDLIKPIFQDNFFLYQSLLLFTIIILGILFYFIVYGLTQNKSIALISSILFSINYNTAFEMIAIGAYHNFADRVFFLLILFSSFILFIKFIDTKRTIFYLASLLLGVIGVFLSYFSFFYVPFLFFYALLAIFTRKIKFKEKRFLIICSFFYLIIMFLIINLPRFLKIPSMMPAEGFLDFLLTNPSQILIHFFRQLTIMSVPDFILRQFFAIFNIGFTQAIYYGNGIHYLYIPTFLIYIAAGIFLYKNQKKLRPVIIASLLFFPCIFLLNLYMRAEIVTLLEPGSRYLYAPSIAFSIFWGVFLATIYNRSEKAKPFIYLIIAFWIGIQLISINRQIKQESNYHIATKKIISYFKDSLSTKLKENSIVLTPRPMGNWGSFFLNKFYGKKLTIFTPRMDSQFEWSNGYASPYSSAGSGKFRRSFDPKKDFIIYYDFEREKVIDVTKDYKAIIKYE